MAPLLVGLCFGLAYVVTGRMLEGRLGGLVQLGHRFAIKPVPGLTLESLRMRYGAERVDLLGPAPELLPEPEPAESALVPGAVPELPLLDPLEALPPLPLPQPPSPSATVGAPPPAWR